MGVADEDGASIELIDDSTIRLLFEEIEDEMEEIQKIMNEQLCALKISSFFVSLSAVFGMGSMRGQLNRHETYAVLYTIALFGTCSIAALYIGTR
jgi:hypothetical protein